MSKIIETRIGLTPVLKRLAYSFLCKGFGRHAIDHALYDEVEVAQLYPWQTNPARTDEYGGGVTVAFYKKGRKVRWVEFSIRASGGGGDPAVYSVE